MTTTQNTHQMASLGSSLWNPQIKSFNQRRFYPASVVAAGRNHRIPFICAERSFAMDLKCVKNDFHPFTLSSEARGSASISISDLGKKFGRKLGSIPFCGLNHYPVEDKKRIQPSDLIAGLLTFIMAGFISPRLVLGVLHRISDFVCFKDVSIALSQDAAFYIGVSIFSVIIHYVRMRNNWSPTRHLRDYLPSSISARFCIMFGVPLLMGMWKCVNLDVEGISMIKLVAPVLASCYAQTAYEFLFMLGGLSTGHLAPIFEVYRVYQITKSAWLVEKAFGALTATNKKSIGRMNDLKRMMLMVLIVGVVCLWHLFSYLLRLFAPERVAGKTDK